VIGRVPLLMNPGPVTISARVRRALDAPDLCHREPEYAALQAELRDALVRVHPARETVLTAVLLTGSGTAAVESMVGSLVPRGARALVVANGAYGERMARILETAGRPPRVLRAEWTEAPDAGAVERALEAEPEIGWLLAVHHETTTGRLNDLDAIGAICRRRGVRLLLDSVSSFGAEAIDWEGWNLEACASTANKCLHGVPGVAFVVARDEAFASRRSGAASLYLDLFAHRSAQDAGHPLFTPAVHVAFALREALAELAEQGGWRVRQRRYRELSGRLRSGLRALGVGMLLESEAASASSLTAFQLPPGIDFQTLHDGLVRSGFVIYPGQEHLGERIFRLAVMGSLAMSDIERFLEAFAQIGSAAGQLIAGSNSA
jgi:2-aminoethylphosphonate-pyruvate transaminase